MRLLSASCVCSVCFVDCLSFFEGFDDFDVFDLHWIDFQRVAVEDHHVGELAGFEGALGVFFAVLEGGVDGDCLEGFERSDALIGADDLAGAREAVDGGPDGCHLIDGCDAVVGVIGGAEAEVDCGAHGAHKVVLFFAAVRGVGVGEEEGVFGEEGWDEFVLHVLLELVFAGELRVDDDGAAVFVEASGGGEFVGFEGHVDGAVAVGVHEHLQAVVVTLLHGRG
jgi:hypothetical protein